MSKLPESPMTLSRHLRQQQRQMQRQQQSSAFARSGTSVTAENVTQVDGELDVVGALAVTGPASFSGNTTIGGNAAITGTLSLPAGVINNAALSDPITTGIAAAATTTGWSTATTHAAKASTTIAVPAGFSKATVTAWANMHFQDSAPNGGYVRATIAGNSGAEMGGLANLNLGQSASHAVILTGLSGGTITVTADCRSTVASSVTTGRIAQINATALFER